MSTTVQPATATAPSTPLNLRTGVAVAIGAASGPLRQDQPLDLWATGDMDTHAYEALYNPARISLADAEASIRTQLAEHNVHVEAFLNDDGPLTAAQRGTDWMLRWGCTPWCVNDHTSPTTADWHADGPTETALRNIDAANSPSENAKIPFLAARTVVINDKPQAYGRETRVWLDYGTSTGELSPAEARQVLEAMRGFVAQFAAVVEHAERTAVDDFDGDPEIARLDREAEDRRIRAFIETPG
ncbi:hypothetical protein QR97_12840 [Streptomyces sp. PBH53]|uniref:DUF6907 domain-containing protein n=1 Tax=Streptomyces sp. PBH53 TaxID=1577075 RepID=UPI0006550BE1|nr:hypothetical protein [Streptomyces sp. PBH53]AKN70597.1 hypothetical protein QR97_12840 [Streptomyces sp. PBH53]